MNLSPGDVLFFDNKTLQRKYITGQIQSILAGIVTVSCYLTELAHCSIIYKLSAHFF
jgi:hypothetical protein